MTATTQEIGRLRQHGWSIREIAKELGVSKYTVEKTLKEVDANSFQTGVSDAQTPSGNTVRTLQSSDQTGGNSCLQPSQTQQQPVVGVNQTATEDGVSQESHQIQQNKAPEEEYVMGTYGFMTYYWLFIYDLKKILQRPGDIWADDLYRGRIKELEKLQVRAKHHCWEHGVEYEMLYVSQVLDACESYLSKVAKSPVIYISHSGIKKLKCHQDDELLEVLKWVHESNFFYLGPKPGETFDKHYLI